MNQLRGASDAGDGEWYPQITVSPSYPVDDVSYVWLVCEPLQIRLNLTAVEADEFAVLAWRSCCAVS